MMKRNEEVFLKKARQTSLKKATRKEKTMVKTVLKKKPKKMEEKTKSPVAPTWTHPTEETPLI